MRKKMEIVNPELTKIQERIKNAQTQEEKIAANQEMMNKYKEYNMNPMKTMIGCLPLLIQIPILFGLYVSLKWPSSGGRGAHFWPDGRGNGSTDGGECRLSHALRHAEGCAEGHGGLFHPTAE